MSSSEVLIFIICSRVIQPLCWSLPGSNKCRIERLCVHVCVYIWTCWLPSFSLARCVSLSSALGVCWKRKEHHGRGFGSGPPATHHPLPLLWTGDRWCWGEVLHRAGPGKKGELSKKRTAFDKLTHTFPEQFFFYFYFFCAFGPFHHFSILIFIRQYRSSMHSGEMDRRPSIGWLFPAAFLFVPLSSPLSSTSCWAEDMLMTENFDNNLNW